MTHTPAFQAFQRAFAQHLRDPHHVKRPAGVPDRRAKVYQALLFNNLCGFIDRCFPVSRELIGPPRWARLCRTFYRDWPLSDPLPRHIPREFVAYLASGEIKQPLPAWLPELLHYEWAELAVDIMDVSLPAHNPDGDCLEGRPLINPASMMLAYVWPVHRISPDYRPRKAPATPTHLVVHRSPEGEVRFAQINAVTQRLLSLIAAGHTGRAALTALAAELSHPQHNKLIEYGGAMLKDLSRQGVILGTAV